MNTPVLTVRRALLKVSLAACVVALSAGCATLQTWLPSWMTAPPSLSSLSWLPWFHSGPKVGALPAFDAKVTPRLNWQASVGGSGGAGFAPAVRADTIYAAAANGTLLAVDSATGVQRWRASSGKPLSAGVGATTGKSLWEAKVSSEVSGPPRPADSIIVVWSLDGRIFGLSAADGSRKWVYQRSTPPLTVRRFPGGVVNRGGLFTGTPGGKLLAIDVANGTLGWEANVTTPKGATELERLADITSLPVIEERQVCAAAYLGRVACFDAQRGTLTWSRDFGSLGGLTVDSRYLYLTDDKGAVQALDKSTGASVWKQDKLSQRYPSGPVILGDHLAVVDIEGYLHVLDRNDGNLIGRLATDGKAPMSQPVAVGEAAVWQSTAGNLISASAK
jgi:outer membrane protein assembly factor BamB